MALVKCPECQKEISDTSSKCSGCGFMLRKPKRGFFGKLIKYGFIFFNFIMAVWLIGGVGSASKGMDSLSGAEQAGVAIGTGLGAMFILVIWVIGAIVGGIFLLLTRPKSD